MVVVTESKCSAHLSYLRHGLDRSSMFQQKLHDFNAILLASNVQGCETILKIK